MATSWWNWISPGFTKLAERLRAAVRLGLLQIRKLVAHFLAQRILEEPASSEQPDRVVDVVGQEARILALLVRGSLQADAEDQSFHGVARHILTHWFELPRALDWIEGLLAAAERDGMRGREGVAAVNSVFTYVLMRAELGQGVRQARVVHRKLPRGRKHECRWSRIRANASEYETAHFDVYFEYGLDALLAGIAAVHERET